MFLQKLIIINYKSCQNLQISFEKDRPNIFIGINDCGKSSVLRAIQLLLEEKRPQFYYLTEDKLKSDLSNTLVSQTDYEKIFTDNDLPTLSYAENSSCCIVIGAFHLEEPDLLEFTEGGLSSHLSWVIENTEDEIVWLARVFNPETKKHLDYLLTPDSSTHSELYETTQARLNKFKKELSVTNEDVDSESNLGKPKNSELARAIYKKLDVEPHWRKYSKRTKDNGFWIEYRYLDWNVTLDDLNTFINDTISQKINHLISSVSDFAKGKADEAQEILNEELQNFTDSFTADLPHIKSLKANINFPIDTKVTDIFINKRNADGDIHLESQGDGIKRQLWFALIKWSALDAIKLGMSNKKFIWGFDEPETHLYPKAQRDFFDIIKKVSKANIQSLISTHSTVFIDRVRLTAVKKVDLKEGYTFISKCDGISDIYNSLQLRNSDFLFFDKFLVVEGDTEESLIPRLYKLYTSHSLHEDNIQLINLGGKDKRKQNQRILAEILQGFKKDIDNTIVYIFDNDARFTFTDTELGNMDNTYLVGKQDIEDSISNDVWYAILQTKMDDLMGLSHDDIENVKDAIPEVKDNPKLDANKKFYRKFKDMVGKRMEENGLKRSDASDILSEKGKEWGNTIADHISDKALIPDKVKEAFDKLK